MSWFDDIKRFFWIGKEGFAIGVIAAFILAYAMKSYGYDYFTFSTASTGLLDKFISKAQPIQEFAFKKSVIIFMLMGGTFGAYLDNYLTKRRII